MELSKEMKLIIAKSERNGNKWLPLWVHAMDTAGVIGYLLRTRYQHLDDVCGMAFEELKRTAVLLAYLHDIGKITPLFQSMILKALPSRRSVFEHYGMNIPDNLPDKEKSHHTICGEAILLNRGFNRDFASIVGAHHGMPSNSPKKHIAAYEYHFFGSPRQPELWNALYDEAIAFAFDRAGFSDISEVPALNKRTQVLLSGLLVMSDWLASNQDNFGLMDEDVILSEKEYPRERLDNAIERLGLPDAWEAGQFRLSDEDFMERFSFPMNELQRAVIDAATGCNSAGLFILEAPMGIGKTEAALSAAEILAAKNEKTGLFFGLPTQATANGIFERVVKWAELQSCDAFHSINLAHGSAELQPEFVKMQKSIPRVDDDGDSGLTVHSFFKGNKQSLLADFVVGTVDRLLMSALKKKHAMLLHLGLSQKVVVIDECHAYDAYMNRYLDRALTWLREYQVPVILLSATLPAKRRGELVNAYFNLTDENIKLPEAAYPRLTYTDGGEIKAIPLPLDIPSKTVRITRAEDDAVKALLERAVNAGACVGIICNTVSRAQHFAELARNIDKSNVILYHAQFIFSDRVDREEELKNAVGKNSEFSARRGTVVVGTQVLEQSLDIDFDLLITDLCPMDLLLQRIGRLQRHKRTDRPRGYENAECVVLGTDELLSASEKMYTRWLLLRTRELLPAEIVVPRDIDELVCAVYSEAEPGGDDEQAALDEYLQQIAIKKQNAAGFLMPPPRDSRRNNDLHDWLNNALECYDNKALAAVRDGISSIEVIVLVKYQNDMLGLLPWRSEGERFSPSVCPSEEECKLIASQRLRLPSRFCYAPDKTINELEQHDRHLTGFQGSHLLKGELFLLLDEKLTAELCGFRLTYSREDGLSYKKEELN